MPAAAVICEEPSVCLRRSPLSISRLVHSQPIMNYTRPGGTAIIGSVLISETLGHYPIIAGVCLRCALSVTTPKKPPGFFLSRTTHTGGSLRSWGAIISNAYRYIIGARGKLQGLRPSGLSVVRRRKLEATDLADFLALFTLLHALLI